MVHAALRLTFGKPTHSLPSSPFILAPRQGTTDVRELNAEIMMLANVMMVFVIRMGAISMPTGREIKPSSAKDRNFRWIQTNLSAS